VTLWASNENSPGGIFWSDACNPHCPSDERPRLEITYTIPDATAPTAPSNLTVSNTTQDSLTLSWADTANNEEGFKIYRWDGGVSEFLYHDSVAADTTSYTDTGLNCGWEYFYKVSAYNTSGESALVGQVSGTLQSCNVADTTKPTGNITAPSNNSTIGPGTVSFSATASDNTGGSGVERVEFYVYYNGQWHGLGADYTAPYGLQWQTPTDLGSQQLQFGIHVRDNAGNIAIDPGGTRTVNFVASQGNPGVVENWIPASKRAYLNQRSLIPAGDSKCGSASAAMVLAMNGAIGKDYAAMRDTANAIYPNTIKGGQIWLYLIAAEMRKRGLAAYEKNPASEWTLIKQEIDAGYPVIVRDGRKMTSYGHLFVVVGYRETATQKQVIAYDPYGKWRGSLNSYNRNSSSATSHKGQWVYYDYHASIGNWMITARPTSAQRAEATLQTALTLTEPDLVSDEAEEIATYTGVTVEIQNRLFLPLILK
jgi:hypothetical protein